MVNSSKQVWEVGETVSSRLTAAVAQRLGVSVSFARWQKHKPTGAQVPVFAVPRDAIPAAQALGLMVEAA